MKNYKNLLLLLLVLGVSQQQKTSTCKLTVTTHEDKTLLNSNIDLYPAVYSSPVDNLNNHYFNIFKAEPIDGCTVITEPKIDRPGDMANPYLVVIDSEAGLCGMRRKIKMAKDVGAKGVIILSEELQHVNDPYGDQSESSFLVFVTKPSEAKKVLLSDAYFVGTISNKQDNQPKPELELWITTLDTRSYELLQIWSETLAQIPALKENLKWRPRYALWGCNSGLFSPGATCSENPEYKSTCACGGEFCSPETKYKAADAIVKEDIRQKIIFRDYNSQYLTYIKGFMGSCLKDFQKNFYVEDCASSLLMSLNIDYSQIQQKVDNFMSKCSGDLFQSLLLDRNRFSQLGEYPSAMLYRQSIEYSGKKDFQVKLCRRLGLEKEEGCSRVMRKNTIISITIDILFFVLIAGGLALIVVGLFFLYKKTIKKELNKEMKMQVSASVEHYFALTQTK